MEVPTGFVEAEANGFQIFTRPYYYDEAVSIARRDPETVLAEGARGDSTDALPMRGRGRVIELSVGDGETLIFKKKRRGGLYGKLMGDVFKNDWQAASEVALSETAWKKGVPVAQVAFAMWAPAGEGRLASYRRAYLASIKVPGARSLMEWIEGESTPGELREVLRAAGETVVRAHERGFYHADLNLGNVLISRSEQGEYSAWLIDLNNSQLGRNLRFNRRLDNLMRLYRSAEKWAPADPPVRLRQAARFMRGYAKGDRIEARRYFQAAARYRASLMLHRLSWRARRSSAATRA